MRSRAIRLTLAIVAVIAISGLGVFLFWSEAQLNQQHAAFGVFESSTREALDRLADLKIAQAAYVAAGQGVGFWMRKATSTLDGATGGVRMLRESATSADARDSLDAAAKVLADFATIDKR